MRIVRRLNFTKYIWFYDAKADFNFNTQVLGR